MPSLFDQDGSSALDANIERAATFIRQRLRSGDYGLTCVGNDGNPRFSDKKGHIFVASFITEAMIGLLDEIDRTIILMRILSEEIDGLWGFSPPGLRHMEQFIKFHVDSDDTAYVIRTLRLLGVNRPPDRLVQFYRNQENLFVTFDALGSTALTNEKSPNNNLMSHLEVNANIYLALKDTHQDNFIDYDIFRRTQDDAGFWPSYFYPSPLFATTLILDLLRGKPQFSSEIGRASSFIVGAQFSNGSWSDDPYETALAISALATINSAPAAIRKGTDYLLATMVEDGSWTSPTCVWEFHASQGDVWRAYDTSRALVSARCLTALRKSVKLFANGPR